MRLGLLTYDGNYRLLIRISPPMPAVDSATIEVAKQIRVQVEGASKHELEATTYVLAEMGFDDLEFVVEQRAAQGRQLRKAPALIVTVPNETPERFVRQLVDHALRDLRLFPRLAAGRAVAQPGNADMMGGSASR